MPVNPIIECFSRELVPEYCWGLESSTVYTAPTFFVKSICGRSNRSLLGLLSNLYAEQIIPIFLTSNNNISQCLAIALTSTQLGLYEMFEVLQNVRINKYVGLRGILNSHLPREVLLYRLARGIPVKEGVPYLLQSRVRAPPSYLWGTILALQISLNMWLPPRPLHCKCQHILQPPHRVKAIVEHKHPQNRYRQTQRVVWYHALHPALVVLPLLSAVTKTCLPPSLIQKPVRSLQIHCECDV
jgi:hypothetical protein